MICKVCHTLKNPGHYIQLGRIASNCCICISARYSTHVNNMDGKYNMCSACSKGVSHTGNIDSEECVYKCLSVVQTIFRETVNIRKNYTVNGEKKRSIDILITSDDFSIFIEKDENQHKGYNIEQEHAKLKDQVGELLKSDDFSKKKKVLVIRYNPNSAYKNVSDGYVSEVSEYNSVERLIILRRWIMWYILNIGKMRTCVVMYMWYNFDCGVVCEKFNGIFKVNHAPANEVTDWAWCPTHKEVGMSKINDMAVSIGDMWKEENEGDYVYIDGFRKV
jgi:hypothetical protein